ADGVALTEDSGGVRPPALDGGVVQSGTSVATSGDLGGGATGAELQGGQGVAHLPGPITTVRAVTQTQPPSEVVPPALDGGVVQSGTTVATTDGDLGGGVARADLHGG